MVRTQIDSEDNRSNGGKDFMVSVDGKVGIGCGAIMNTGPVICFRFEGNAGIGTHTPTCRMDIVAGN